MKKTLLEIVQEILNDLDSEQVNSISDSVEADQVASIVQSTFENIVATRYVPEHKELIQLTPLSDTAFPTHFEVQDNTKQIDNVWYDVGTTEVQYRELTYVEPLTFLQRTDGIEDYVTVTDKNGGTTYRVGTDDNPSFYTSFDDRYIVCNSYDSTVDSSLQASKSRAYGTVYPTFTKSDTFVPDLDAPMFRYLINESKSMCFSVMKGGPDAKVDQAARRQKQYVQNDKKRVGNTAKWSNYGRN